VKHEIEGVKVSVAAVCQARSLGLVNGLLVVDIDTLVETFVGDG
jgi:hypothetical protein